MDEDRRRAGPEEDFGPAVPDDNPTPPRTSTRRNMASPEVTLRLHAADLAERAGFRHHALELRHQAERHADVQLAERALRSDGAA